MLRVLLIRHGESVWNHGSKFTGWTNIPLTDKGKKDGLVVASTLKKNSLYPNVFFSSVLKRALDTSTIIQKEFSDQSCTYTSWRLNEKHYGSLEGLPRKYIRQEYGDKFTEVMRHNFYMKPPILPDNEKVETEYKIFKNCYFDSIKNGESKENVLQRLLPYFENDILYSANEGKLPLVVSHKHCMRVLMKHYLNMSDEEFENYKLPDNSIILMEFNDDFSFKKHTIINLIYD
jgi:2,3-bisphosphoglycerate-dependent phosphoglycerate mutase